MMMISEGPVDAPSTQRTRPPPACLRSVIFCEATAIYGVILSIILTNKTNVPDIASLPLTQAGWAAYYVSARFAGYAVFWSGIAVGLTNLGSGCVGGVRASARCINCARRELNRVSAIGGVRDCCAACVRLSRERRHSPPPRAHS